MKIFLILIAWEWERVYAQFYEEKQKRFFFAALIKFQTIELQIEHVLKLIEKKMGIIMGLICGLCHWGIFTSLKDRF